MVLSRCSSFAVQGVFVRPFLREFSSKGLDMGPEPEPEAEPVATGRPAAVVPDVAAALMLGAGMAALSRSDARRFFGFGGTVER